MKKCVLMLMVLALIIITACNKKETLRTTSTNNTKRSSVGSAIDTVAQLETDLLDLLNRARPYSLAPDELDAGDLRGEGLLNHFCNKCNILFGGGGALDIKASNAALYATALDLFERLIMWHIETQEHEVYNRVHLSANHFYCNNALCEHEPYIPGDCGIYAFKRVMRTLRPDGQEWRESVMELRNTLYALVTALEKLAYLQTIDEHCGSVSRSRECLSVYTFALLFYANNASRVIIISNGVQQTAEEWLRNGSII